MPAGKCFAVYLTRDSAPFVQRAEATVDHAFFTPQHQHRLLQESASGAIDSVVLEVDARSGTIVFAHPMRGSRKGDTSLVLGKRSRVERSKASTSFA